MEDYKTKYEESQLEVDALKFKLQKLTEVVRNLLTQQSQNQDVVNRNLSLEAKIDELNLQISKNEDIIKVKNDEVLNYKKQYNEMNNNYKEIKEKYENFINNRFAQLVNAIEPLKNEVTNLRDENEKLKKIIIELENSSELNQNSDYKETVAYLSGIIENLKQKKNQALKNSPNLDSPKKKKHKSYLNSSRKTSGKSSKQLKVDSVKKKRKPRKILI